MKFLKTSSGIFLFNLLTVEIINNEKIITNTLFVVKYFLFTQNSIKLILIYRRLIILFLNNLLYYQYEAFIFSIFMYLFLFFLSCSNEESNKYVFFMSHDLELSSNQEQVIKYVQGYIGINLYL